jgi:DNA-binding transcriptional MerR regulator
MKRDLVFNKAVSFRKKGYSLREISEILKISKSTASLWLSQVQIGISGCKRLEKLKKEALNKSKEVKKKQKMIRLKKIEENCSVLNDDKMILKDDYKIFLALLFWGEGSKGDRRVVFMNSDADMIRSYLFLLRSSFSIKENKLRATLHLHGYHDKEKMLEYWSEVTGIKTNNISVYSKSNTGIRKKDNYSGCISLRYGDVNILDEIFLIIKRFSAKIK